MICFKLLRMRRDATLGPLFINKRQVIPFHEWLEAELHATPGYAVRKGWHCLARPCAPHLSMKGRIWCKVEISDFEAYTRPENQGGLWYLAQKMRVLDIL